MHTESANESSALQIPEEKAGLVIGMAGVTIKRLCKESGGCTIRVSTVSMLFSFTLFSLW